MSLTQIRNPSTVKLYATQARIKLEPCHNIRCRDEGRIDENKTSRTTEIKVLRSIKGVTLRDQVRNETIKEQLQIQDVVMVWKGKTKMEKPYRSNGRKQMGKMGQRQKNPLKKTSWETT